MKIFNKLFNREHPRERYIYAVTKGLYLGELLVYVGRYDTDYTFLSLPKMQNRIVPEDKFKFGIKEGIIEVVKKIPKNVYDICKLQHQKNIS